MHGSWRRRAGATTLGVALVAAACGGDDSSGGSGAASTAAGAPTTAEGTTATSGATQPQSMEEWETLWEKERAATVKRIKDNRWGRSADGKTLTGPGGWTVDLTKCAAGWSDTEGLTDTTIKMGQSIAQSGTYADFGNLARGADVIFAHYSDEGFFKDNAGKTRTINYITKDDGYDAARSIPNVDELIDSEKVFSIQVLGTPGTLKNYDKINQRCIPNALSQTAHTAMGDPVNHPWTSGAPNPNYTTEAILWGTFIESRLAEFPADQKIKVAALVQQNEFGAQYNAGFQQYLAASPALQSRIDYTFEAIEASAPTVTDPMTTLAAEDPDIFIAMLAGAQMSQLILEAAQNGMKEQAKYLIAGQGAAQLTIVGKAKMGGDGSASDGWWVLNPGVKDITDPAFADDPFVKWFIDQLRAKGIDPKSSTQLGTGAGYGVAQSQALAIAGQLDGSLTRSNYMLAVRTIDLTSPMMIPGIRFHMDGLNDPFIVEAGIFQTWNAASQLWVNQGNVINIDGKSRPCAWDQSTSSCK